MSAERMSVEFRDYYEVLGVDRNADSDDIKKAFRKLARKYHPDVSHDPGSEEKFKEVNEAYEVLGDPEKRKAYDALGANWKHGSDFTPPPHWPGSGGYYSGTEGDFHFDGSTGFSDFFESLFGRRATGDPFGRFPGFGGGPRRSRGPERGEDIETDILVSLEEVLHGGERQIRIRKPDGATDSTIRVRVPRGVAEGQLIRCAGRGGEGWNGGESGDLFLRVRYERHPIYRVEGPNLYRELEIRPWQCFLGARPVIPTLHGKIRVTVPPKSQPGDTLRVRGRGLPSIEGDSGDLFIELKVVMPESADDTQAEAWRRLAESYDTNPRSHD